MLAWEKWSEIESWQSIPQLKKIRIDNCPNLKEVPLHSFRETLMELVLSDCGSILASKRCLEGFIKLEHLKVCKYSGSITLPCHSLTSLVVLNVSNDGSKIDFSGGTERLPNLRWLVINGDVQVISDKTKPVMQPKISSAPMTPAGESFSFHSATTSPQVISPFSGALASFDLMDFDATGNGLEKEEIDGNGEISHESDTINEHTLVNLIQTKSWEDTLRDLSNRLDNYEPSDILKNMNLIKELVTKLLGGHRITEETREALYNLYKLGNEKEAIYKADVRQGQREEISHMKCPKDSSTMEKHAADGRHMMKEHSTFKTHPTMSSEELDVVQQQVNAISISTAGKTQFCEDAKSISKVRRQVQELCDENADKMLLSQFLRTIKEARVQLHNLLCQQP